MTTPEDARAAIRREVQTTVDACFIAQQSGRRGSERELIDVAAINIMRLSTPDPEPGDTVRVPREPTEAMLHAGFISPDEEDWFSSMRKTWRAMLAAHEAAATRSPAPDDGGRKCSHGVLLTEDCHTCIESYGNGRTISAPQREFATPPAQEHAADEPVAWRYRRFGTTDWILEENWNDDKFESQPLYTRPEAAAPASAVMASMGGIVFNHEHIKYWELRALAAETSVARLTEALKRAEAERDELQDDYLRRHHEHVDLIETHNAAKARIAKLAKALEEIAKQKLPVEITPEDRADADWEGGFHECVLTARQVL